MLNACHKAVVSKNIFLTNVMLKLWLPKYIIILAESTAMMSSKPSLSYDAAHTHYTGTIKTAYTNGVKICLERCQGIFFIRYMCFYMVIFFLYKWWYHLPHTHIESCSPAWKFRRAQKSCLLQCSRLKNGIWYFLIFAVFSIKTVNENICISEIALSSDFVCEFEHKRETLRKGGWRGIPTFFVLVCTVRIRACPLQYTF